MTVLLLGIFILFYLVIGMALSINTEREGRKYGLEILDWLKAEVEG